jgi:hypothetical protein
MMNCQSAGSYPGSHAEARPATVLIIFPTGLQEPACEDCARYWVNFRPGQTRLAPLSSYVDHYEQAKSALNAQQVLEDEARGARELQARRDAFMHTRPEDHLRRYAVGTPTGQDMYELARCEEGAEVADHQIEGFYNTLAEQAQGKWFRYRLEAQQALRGRGFHGPETEPYDIQFKTHHVHSDTATHSHAWAGGLVAMAFGVLLMIFGGITFAHGGNDLGPNGAGETWTGVFMVLFGLVLFLAPPVIAIARSAREAHESWISQYSPEQQAQIRKAERAAIWAGTAAAAVALHASNKRTGEKLSASVIGTGPPPGKAGAAMWQAKQQARRESQARKPGSSAASGAARRQPGKRPAPPDPTATALGRSQLSEAGQRHRRELGW